MRAPLDGIKVLDMAWVGPGPFCATLLGDLGAEIIKIHEPQPERRGSLIMYAFPNTPAFPGLRNCKSMGLDLKSAGGRKIFHELAKTADVLIESFRPGVMKRLGIDYGTLSQLNPGLVYASLTGYGQDGPYRDLPGHDINYISVGGLLGMTGVAGGPPVIPGLLVADMAAGGIGTALGVVAALRARDITGRGQLVDMSITDGVAELMSMWINPLLTYGIEYRRGETMFTGLYPWYNVYETGDGKHISVGALEPYFYAALCKALGREDFVPHQFAEGEKREEIFRHFREMFLQKPRDEWVEELKAQCCVAPVYTIEELVKDPQLLARGMIKDLPHPRLGSVKQVGSMLKLSETPFRVRNWCTRFGEHTDEVLSGLGYDAAAIESLRRNETVS
ncbi:MAG: CoA transferase [Dehalococcoidia bacterium]|nr:CoA transferase [Dehalococcoidia bacterium]